MRTNHSRGYVDPGTHGSWTSVNKPVKDDARRIRRAIERHLLHRILVNDIDPDQVSFPCRNVEVSEIWCYD